MSEPEGFLTRWSRRKREVAEEEAAASEDVTPRADVAPATALPDPPPQAAEGGEGAFDPASLPPIESITADTDLSAFFKPGVPADLVRAALRRAWTSDPKIRDFVDLAENTWDFNAGAIPGFTPFGVADEVGRVVAQSLDEAGRMFERQALPPEEAPAQPPASTRLSDAASKAGQASRQSREDQASAAAEKSGQQPPGDDPTELPKVDIASQHKSDAPQYAELPARRTHGRALPE